MVKVLGIDEAGRGPVIGPLVISGFMIDEKSIPKLKKLGVKDSKLLLSNKREELAKKLKKFRHEIIMVEPSEIDLAVNGKDNLNLNWLEARKTAEIINELKPDKAIIDSPSSNLKAYASYIRDYLHNKDIELIAENKADVKYPVVSAASIIAKSTREEEVKKIEKMVGQSIGSGYPSNQICRKFLEANWDRYPNIFRKSWASYRRVLKQISQKNLGEY
ncbi:ribonuclease HII [Candidatus Woesearchaeota archaeon]|nr:ribonuclease HII [Candidatus Woesearchaeota archaeon]